MRGTYADSIDPDRIDTQIPEQLDITLQVGESGVVERVAFSISLMRREI